MILFGSGNMLSDAYDCCRATNRRVTAIFLNAPETIRPRTKSLVRRLEELAEAPMVAPLAAFSPGQGEEYFVVPTTPLKAALVDQLKERFGITFARLVHPTAYVSPYATLGEGVFVGAISVVGPGASLHDHAFVNRGVTVGHDTQVESYARLQPGCNIGGHVTIGHGAMVGIGANVREELVIGAGATIAAGAAVIADVPSGALVAGVPATVKRAGPGR